jgi:hypothetical protein
VVRLVPTPQSSKIVRMNEQKRQKQMKWQNEMVRKQRRRIFSKILENFVVDFVMGCCCLLWSDLSTNWRKKRFSSSPRLQNHEKMIQREWRGQRRMRRMMIQLVKMKKNVVVRDGS